MFEVDVRRIEYANDALCLRVRSFLCSRHFPEFRDLLIEVDDGTVTLSGTLSSHYQKQIALNSCRRVAGVLDTRDKIKVLKKAK